MKQEFIKIIEGAEYIYTSTHPRGCGGCRYRVLKLVMAVPSYQDQVCVEALEGPDKGKWFVCSPHNFSTRYIAVEPEPVPAVEEKMAGYVSQGSGV